MEGTSGSSCLNSETNAGENAVLHQLSLEHCECAGSNVLGKEVSNSLELSETGLGKTSCDTLLCAICHDRIKAAETAQIKGCEHLYCVTCILRWASYKKEPWCPQCRVPFSFLYVYRALDGSLSDFMFEESVCLLLRASWFKPLTFQEQEEHEDFPDDYDDEEYYYTSNIRLGNRRWGDSGYVRAGRREARPVVRQVPSSNGLGPSSKPKEPLKEPVGRRARRAQKREQLDKMTGKQSQR